MRARRAAARRGAWAAYDDGGGESQGMDESQADANAAADRAATWRAVADEKGCPRDWEPREGKRKSSRLSGEPAPDLLDDVAPAAPGRSESLRGAHWLAYGAASIPHSPV